MKESTRLYYEQPFAIDGSLPGLVIGPNCRTRSVLRHYPLRAWDKPWGKKGLEKSEEERVRDGDIMMWRGIFLFVAQGHG